MLINRLVWVKKGADGPGSLSGQADLPHLTRQRLQQIFDEDDPDELLNGSIPVTLEQLAMLVHGTNIPVDPGRHAYVFEIVSG